MKATFLIPPILKGSRATERVAGCTYTLYPVPNIYELTVAAVLEKEKHAVNYIEAVIENWTENDFISFLKKDDSQLYSIWTVNLGKENDLKALSVIRSIKPSVSVVFMGPSPTYFTEDFLVDENTYVVRGEPDYTMRELVRVLENNGDISLVKGVSYRRDKKFFHNQSRELIENLDELPFPARHLIDKDKYHNPKLKKSPYTAVFTSRNCPHRCIFCVPSSLSFARELEYKKIHSCKPPLKMRSPQNVIDELSLLNQEGYKSISFQDDHFIWGDERTFKICEALKKYDFIWGCQARADQIKNKELIKAMAESGCKYVDIGVESFDQKILDYIKKDIKVEDNIRAIKLLRECGISAKINVLFGASPLETKETINHTRKMIKKLKVDQVMFSACNPFPGTEFFNLAKANGWLSIKNYEAVDVQKQTIINYPHLSNEELARAVYDSNLKFFLSPSFVFKNMLKFRSIGDFFTASKALYRKLWG